MLKTDALCSLVIQTLDDHKANDIKEIDVSSLTNVTDRMIICSATSTRHATALADKLLRAVRDEGIRPLGIEGQALGEWILVDLISVVVHIMLPATREFYDLEKLWRTTERFRKEHEN